MKKWIAMLLCLGVLITALPAAPVNAATAETADTEMTEQQRITKEAKRIYNRCLRATGRSSFTGVCGLMTSHQLRQMGINKYLVVNDGNKQYDYYKDRKVTTGGYYIRALSAERYSLESALNALTDNGTMDVYNILVGFQWTKTAAGHRYGHACVINAILDGTVYFVESYYSSLGGPEGTVLKCSIREFAEYFDRWTRFEGLIYFSENFSDTCSWEETDLFVQTRFDSALRTQPCVLDTNGCKVLRSVSGGELLRADAVYTDAYGDQYYRITEGDQTGYIPAGTVCVRRVNPEGMIAANVAIPRQCDPSEDIAIGGTVTSENTNVATVEVVVSDKTGNVVLRENAEADGKSMLLNVLNGDLQFDLLNKGSYQVEIYAEAACPVAEVHGQTQYSRICLWQQPLQVGLGLYGSGQETETEVQDGWSWVSGNWCYYENGQPKTGWVARNGVRYYLDSTGAAITGWEKVDGQLRCFSATGALCSGWVTTAEGRMYLDGEGVPVCDWQTIGQDLYCFTEEGFLVTGGTTAYEGVEYMLGEDGRAMEIIEETTP